jgi:peptidoglycan/LPS O-acetylase OafA/YrhL
MKKVNRQFGLDLIRATAIIMVVLNHSVGILNPIIELPYLGDFLGKVLALFQPVGFLGVELFFVLSGFLIGRILIKLFNRHSSVSISELFHFWMRRWLRTLPAYWFVLTIIFVFYRTWKPEYYFFLQSYSTNRIVFFVESWSLPVEEFFYLLFPLFLLLGTLLFRNVNPAKKILISILGFIAVFTLARILTIIMYDYQLHQYKQIRMMTFMRLDAIAYGVLVAWLSSFKGQFLSKYARPLFLTGIVFIILITGINYLGTHPAFLWYEKSFTFKAITDLFLYTFYPFSCALLLPYADNLTSSKKTIFNSFVQHTSKISYSLYLLHLVVLRNMIIDPMLNGGIVNSVVLFIFYLLLCFIFSTLLYRTIELPFMNLREKICSKKMRSVTY